MRLARRFAVAVGAVFVLGACGSASVGDGTGAEGAESTDPVGCDADLVAASLAPGSTFDHEPSASPADLASMTDVVFSAGSIVSIEIGGEWSTVTVDDVDIVTERVQDPDLFSGFGTFGAGIDDRPSVPSSALVGMEALVFANRTASAPDGLSAAIEGLWLQCPGGPPVSVIAVPRGQDWVEASHSLDALAAAAAADSSVGDVTIGADQGDGWRLVDVDPGFGHPHEVAVMTSQRALDRAADARWFETRPRPNFVDEIVIVLAPSVSGSCPGIAFEGLTVAEGRVFGTFEPGPPPAGSDGCTNDANPVSFVFIVERRSLPETFTLSVEEEVTCGGCEQAQIDVDLSDEAALESALWGGGSLDIVIDGTPPAEGNANVFRWAPEAALLLSADEFADMPRWIQGFDTGEARTIEGFVVDCGAGGCPEECDDGSCQELRPLGDVCAFPYEPEAFVDHTLTITWDGAECEIAATPGGVGE